MTIYFRYHKGAMDDDANDAVPARKRGNVY